jgi:transposase InsO family protein/transposase-like protein
MSYKKYEPELKAIIIDEYKSFNGSPYQYSHIVDIHPRTLYKWLDKAGVLTGRIRKRKCVKNNKFSLKQKLYAINMRLNGKELALIANKVGCSKMQIINWYNVYKEKGIYFLMSKKDMTNKKLDEIGQEEYIKELEYKIHDLQMVVDAYEMVADILGKQEGLSLTHKLEELPNKIKAQAIYKLRPKYKKNKLLVLFSIKASTYDDNLKADEKPDKYKEIMAKIKKIFYANDYKYGYRRVCNEYRKTNKKIADKVVLRLMNELELKVKHKTMKPYGSYKKDGRPPVKNWLLYKVWDDSAKKYIYKHSFKPNAPWEILGTDVTEFHVNGYKVYLSTVVDFYDKMIVSWSISQHPDMNLMMESLNKLYEKANSRRFILHSDQGSCYRSAKWISACEDMHILQSMSRKGKSGDNAPVESVNGKIKVEFFHNRSFSGLSPKQFMNKLDKYINWYNNDRVFLRLEGMSPVRYREKYKLEMVM